MRKLYLLFCFVIFSFYLHAQNDFFILKRKDKTIKEFFNDVYIHCRLVDGQWVEGIIKNIRSDSVFIQTFHINYLPTIWGTYLPDTVKEEKLKIPIKDIDGFLASDMSKHGVPSGLMLTNALQIGGAGYDALNVINTLADKDPVFASNNIPRLIGGAAAFLIGKILQRIYYPSLLIIGKKYHLDYMGNTSTH